MNPQDESQLPIELDQGLDALFCIFIFFQFQHLNDAMVAVTDASLLLLMVVVVLLLQLLSYHNTYGKLLITWVTELVLYSIPLAAATMNHTAPGLVIRPPNSRLPH